MKERDSLNIFRPEKSPGTKMLSTSSVSESQFPSTITDGTEGWQFVANNLSSLSWQHMLTEHGFQGIKDVDYYIPYSIDAITPILADNNPAPALIGSTQYVYLIHGQYKLLRGSSSGLRSRVGLIGGYVIYQRETALNVWEQVMSEVPEVTGLRARLGVRGGNWVCDVELSVLGFAGTNGAGNDWVNASEIESWTSYWNLVYEAMPVKPMGIYLDAQKDLVKDLCVAGTFNKAKVIDLFATHTGGSAVNWASPGTFDPVVVNAPIFTEHAGYKGVSGTSSYINLNFRPSIDGGSIAKDNIYFLVGVGTDVVNDGQYGALSNISGENVLLGGRVKSDHIGSGYYGCNSLDSTNNMYRNFIWSSKKHIAVSRGADGDLDTYMNYSKNNDNYSDSNHCIDISPFLGCINNGGSPAYYDNDRTYRYAFISEYLTETESIGTIAAFEKYLTAIGTGLISDTLYSLGLEGHSFLDGQRNVSWLSQRIMENLPCVKTINKAVSGSSLDMMTARSVAIDAEINDSYTNKLIVWNGVNDMDDSVGTAAIAYPKLKTYVQARLAAGWDDVYVYTVTAATSGRGANFEFERQVFNDFLRTDLAPISGVHILDVDMIYQLLDSTDAAYYSGGLHFNSLADGGAEMASSLAILTLNNHLPEAIDDGNTFNYSNRDSDSNFTVNGSNLIATWIKEKGYGPDFVQATAGYKPLLTADGVLTDGTDDSLATGATTLNQPCIYYEMFRMPTFKNSGFVHDGAGWGSVCMYEGPTTGKLKAGAGALLSSVGFPKDHAVNKWGMMRIQYNGASSKIVSNTGTIIQNYNGVTGEATNGNLGAANPAGVTLGSRGGGPEQAANVEYKEVLIRKGAENHSIENRFFLHIFLKWLSIIDPDYPY